MDGNSSSLRNCVNRKRNLENYEIPPASKRHCDNHKPVYSADHSRAYAPNQKRKRQLQAYPYMYPAKRQSLFSEYPCLTENLSQIAVISPRKAIYELNSHFEEFKQLVSIHEFPQEKQVLMHFIRIFARIVNLKVDKRDKIQKALDNIIDVLLDQVGSGGFYLSLSQFISCMPTFGNPDKRIEFCSILENVISLFSALLDRNSTQAARYLPIDVCVGTAQQLSLQDYFFKEINEMAQRLLKKRNRICTAVYESKVKSPHSSKSSVVLPSPEELNPKSVSIKKKVTNIVDGSFPSIEEYLKVQRELLRDDFINPLRSALIECQEDSKAIKYTEVKFHPKETFTTSGALAYKLSFKTSKKINWKRSVKTLKYGSLLCLSDDNFKTVLYATVAEREISELENGLLTVQLQGHDGRSLPTLREFTMIESPVYFVAYAPVIEKLYEIEPQHLCFSQYLVQLQKTVAKPTYLRNKREVIFNLKGIICNCDEKKCKHEQVHLMDRHSWDNSLATSTLDDSQKKALHMALTSELALIQGPPGTGKTYVGLKIIQTLLQNRHFWEYQAQGKCPIIVVCYTNHALDQFLEGLIDLRLPNTDIVRVGGRCNSEKVKKFKLREIEKAYRRDHGHFHHNPRHLLNTHKTVEALEEFIHGDFVSSNCKIYASFLTLEIIDRFQQHCNIDFPYYESTTALSFACWLDKDIEQRVYNFHPSQNEDVDYELDVLDEDRQAYDDHGIETREVLTVLGKKGVEAFMQKLGGVLPLQDQEAERYLDAYEPWPYGWNRLHLFKYCLMELLEACRKKHWSNIDEQSVYDMKSKEIKIKCLQQANVIGLTTTGAAMNSAILSEVQSKIMIVEEAAEVLEPQIIATLTEHTQHLILIGDHKQLRPKTNDYTIGTKHKLEISMFERLVKNSLPLTTLSVQHRMRPEISQIVSKHFYQNLLLDHETIKSYANVRGMKHNVYFVNHSEFENSNPDLNGKSYSNSHEAVFLASLFNYLVQQGYGPQQITIITPYVGQQFEIRSQLKQKGITDVQDRVVTIDNYQGEENDIILLSLVRSNKEKKIGFVKNENRICVALSRAKCGLYCIGNFKMLRNCPKTRLWSSIVADLESKFLLGDKLQLQCVRHQNVTEVSRAEDFERAPDGGCNQDCDERRSKCNHRCPRKCHPDDPDHVNRCTEPCSERCDADEHWCPLLCYEECGKCTIKMKKVIPGCEHEQEVPCPMNPKLFVCQKPCSKLLPCGHKCKNKCGEPCTTKCDEFAPRKLICGHKVKVKCYLDEYQAALKCDKPCRVELACEHLCSGKCGDCRQGRLHIPCNKKCTRILLCGHSCSGRCAKNCPPCKKGCAYACPHGKCGNVCYSPCRPCTHRCKWICDHKRCTRKCGQLCNRKRCDEPCSKKLKCRHPCLGLCGEPCPTVCHNCNTVKDKVQIIMGDEHNKNAGYRYIKLDDCQHVFAVEALDHWMDQKDESIHQIIQWKGCPICKKPVMKTLRYANVAKQLLRDLNEVKKKEFYFLTTHQRQQMKKELSQIPKEELEGIGLNFPSSVQAKIVSDAELQKVYVSFLSASNVLQAHKDIDQLLEVQKSGTKTATLAERQLILFLSQASDFLDLIKTYQDCNKLTDQMILDITAEHKRFLLLQKCLKLECAMIATAQDDQTSKDLSDVQSACATSFMKLSDQDYQTKSELLKSVQGRQQIPLTIEERKMIISAIGAKPGSWYKCPQGHFYNIGECGGAMQIGKCPECGSQIGGQNHRLIETNEHAGDFDGSGYAAWSAGANLLNFDLRGLN